MTEEMEKYASALIAAGIPLASVMITKQLSDGAYLLSYSYLEDGEEKKHPFNTGGFLNESRTLMDLVNIAINIGISRYNCLRKAQEMTK